MPDVFTPPNVAHYGKNRCPKIDRGSGYMCTGVRGHGRLFSSRLNDWTDHLHHESGTGWAESECQPPVIPEPTAEQIDQRIEQMDVREARAAAVSAVAAGLAITERGLPVWPPEAFDLADVLTEYILTGERPT